MGKNKKLTRTTPNKPQNDESPNKNDNNKKTKIINDPRFSSVHSDPRFQKVPKKKAKVEIDSRFNSMFTNPNFSSRSAALDKRGKHRDKVGDAALRTIYEIEKEKSESEEGSGSEESDDVAVESDDLESSTDEEIDEEEEDLDDNEVENVPMIEEETCRLAVVNLDWRHVRAVDLYVVLRSFLPKGGEIKSVSVYPSEFGLQRMKEEELHGPVGLFGGENQDDDDDDDDEIDAKKLREYEKSRLRYYYAVVECDTVATADYLYKACDGVEFERSSNVLDLRFIPDSMEFKHPPRDVAIEAPPSYDGLDFHTKALQHSNIPISWDEDEPLRVKTLKRKFNTEQLADMELKDYLASDDSDTEEEVVEEDIDGEDQSDKKHKKRDKYLALIQSGDGSDEDGEERGQDMEVTFNTGLEDLSQRILEKKRDKKSESVWEATLRKQREKKMGRKNKSKYSSDEDSSDTDIEGMEQSDDDFFIDEPSTEKGKKKGRRSKSDGDSKQDEDTEMGGEASRAELELLLADDNVADNGLKGYNLKPKKSKGKKGKELLDEDKIPSLTHDDPRFSSLFTSPLFALDPTDPQYKRSASYARQVAQKQYKGDRDQSVEEETHEKPPAESLKPFDDHATGKNKDVSSDVLPSKKEKYELSTLVRSVKMKSQQIQLPSKNKISKKSKNPDISTVVQPTKKTKRHK